MKQTDSIEKALDCGKKPTNKPTNKQTNKQTTVKPKCDMHIFLCHFIIKYFVFYSLQKVCIINMPT